MTAIGRSKCRLAEYHGYYGDWCFLPLYVFYGEQLLVSYLRPSNRDPARHAWAILTLLVKRLCLAWPNVKIILRADSGFSRWKTHPSVAFKCGPFALDTVRTADKVVHPRSSVIEGAMSTTKGTSLAMVKAWSEKLGMKFQMAKPAVIHWKLGHFAALVKEKNGRYLIQDPTFGGAELWITPQALDEETSGYFLVPAGTLPAGWTPVSETEADTVWRRGAATAQDRDLPQIRQTQSGANDLLARMVYNTQHEPLLCEDGSGQTTLYTYNSQGQVLTVTDPLSEVTTFSYDSNGFLQSVQAPLSGSHDITDVSFYHGQVQSVTDSEGYEVTFAYDAYDRPVSVMYPDGITDTTGYVNLDAVFHQDNVSTMQYDVLRQLIARTDPNGRTTKYTYCKCGGLATLTDGNGNVTTWTCDLQGRPTQKTFADGHSITYGYETNTSRLKTVTDALSQVKTFSYNDDNTVSGVANTASVNATSNISYTCDSNYPPMTSAANGYNTISYIYNAYITDPYGTATTGAGRVSQITNSALGSSDITYSYDALGRVTSRPLMAVLTPPAGPSMPWAESPV